MVSGNIVTLSKLGNSKSSRIAKKMFTEKNPVLTKKLNEFRKNLQWLAENREKLRKDHGDKYVAVYKQQVCKSFSDPSKLLHYVKKTYGDDPSVVIDFVGKQKVKFLL